MRPVTSPKTRHLELCFGILRRKFFESSFFVSVLWFDDTLLEAHDGSTAHAGVPCVELVHGRVRVLQLLLEQRERPRGVRPMLRRGLLPVRGAELEREDVGDAHVPQAVRIRVQQAVRHHGVPDGDERDRADHWTCDRSVPQPREPRPAVLVSVALDAARAVRHSR